MVGENECQCVLEYLTDGDRFGEWAFPVIAKNVATIRGKLVDRNVFFFIISVVDTCGIFFLRHCVFFLGKFLPCLSSIGGHG